MKPVQPSDTLAARGIRTLTVAWEYLDLYPAARRQ